MEVRIKRMLAFSLAILALCISFIGIIANSSLQQVEQIRSLDNNVEQLQLLCNELYLIDQSFFTYSTISPEFYQTGQSLAIVQHDSLMTLIVEKQKQIRSTLEMHELDTDEAQQVDSLLANYTQTLNRSYLIIRQRGFKNFGTEGEMREHAHWLEDNSAVVNKILMLRRHEKDYFLRNDLTYVTRFNQLVEEVKNTGLSDTSRYHLRQYQSKFNEIVRLESTVGLTTQNGLQMGILKLSNQINDHLGSFSVYTNQEVEKIAHLAKKRFLILILVALGILASITFFIFYQLVVPLDQFTRTIIKYTSSDYKTYAPIKLKSKVSEVNTLATAFDQLIKQLQALLEESQQNNEELEAQNEQLLKTNQELDMFVYSASHDLRSPLTSLAGLISLSSVETDEREREVYHQLMLGRVKRLDGFIHDIIDYARNNRQEVKKDKVIIEQAVDEILTNYEYLDQYKEISIEVNINSEADLYTDATRLAIILRNLFSNALQYYDKGKNCPYLKIEGNVSLDFLTLCIEDNGIGIEPDKLNSIFEMFYRANAEVKGSGLGLYIVKETIDKLGGSISVQSEYGVGTLFQLVISNQAESYTSVALEQTQTVR